MIIAILYFLKKLNIYDLANVRFKKFDICKYFIKNYKIFVKIKIYKN